MRNKLRNLLLVTLISVTAVPGMATAQSQTALCSPGGITVGFFNGVWNTRSQAQSAREALAQLYGDTYAPTGEPISYDNFFNTTGSEHGATGAEGLIETFKQRSLAEPFRAVLGGHLRGYPAELIHPGPVDRWGLCRRAGWHLRRYSRKDSLCSHFLGKYSADTDQLPGAPGTGGRTSSSPQKGGPGRAQSGQSVHERGVPLCNIEGWGSRGESRSHRAGVADIERRVHACRSGSRDQRSTPDRYGACQQREDLGNGARGCFRSRARPHLPQRSAPTAWPAQP